MNILQWLLIEKRLLSCKKTHEFPFVLLSIFQKVLKCQQAIAYRKTGKRYKVETALHVSQVDHRSPLISWLELEFLPALPDEDFALIDVPKHSELPHLQQYKKILHLKLDNTPKNTMAVMCFLPSDLSESQTTLVRLLVDNVGLIYQNLKQAKRSRKWLSAKWSISYRLLLYICVIASLFFIKMPATVLAPAEVSPVRPELVSSSIDGVIKKVLVTPDTKVTKGQQLILLDDIVVKNKLMEAKQAYQVAHQRYLKAYRNAFTDQKSKHELALLQNKIKQAAITKKHYQQLLQRTVISATMDGIAIFSSPNELIGQPIKIGQRIMLLADPHKKVIDFWVPIDNIVNVDSQHALTVYPNLHPLQAISAQLIYINPIAQPMPDGQLGYFGQATFKDGTIKLGEKGMIKLFGERVSLAQLFFQRPLRYFRQLVGI